MIEKLHSKNIQATVQQYSDYNQNNENQDNICFLNIKKTPSVRLKETLIVK